MSKRVFTTVAAVAALAVIFAGLPLRGAPPARPADPAAQTDRAIQTAERAVAAVPSEPSGYRRLASAYLQKGRDTGDFGFTVRAERALDRALELRPGDEETEVLKTLILMNHHRFADARDAARALLARRPDDLRLHGALSDALIELGDYPAAVAATQKMMDTKPGMHAYTRAAHLRSLHGDHEGAIEAMRLAIEHAPPDEPESEAWCHVHLGHELMTSPAAAEAERAYDRALQLFPGYHLALAGKARARIAAGDVDGAIALYRRAQDRVPLAETAMALGDLHAMKGEHDESRRQYDLVELIERSNQTEARLYSQRLAHFWLDHDKKIEEALSAMRREREARADVFTCDGLAWALFKNGKLDEAKAAIDDAMRIGTRDARIHFHAGMIAAKRGDAGEAVKHLRLSLSIDPVFDVRSAAIARKTLDSLAAETRGPR